ncbi:unnamed protein product [Diabrotica balteata]|uniref:Uncharacterized protein n=1 Tax=Diabrotica balteata TaxID=107213 RepID=A0A9N9XGF7_DIABA|nr:unnamed protein product [Diabrotica balteata]
MEQWPLHANGHNRATFVASPDEDMVDIQTSGSVGGGDLHRTTRLGDDDDDGVSHYSVAYAGSHGKCSLTFQN